MMSVMEVNKVAEYFLSKSISGTERAITHLKLQKLVYYAQAYFLATEGDPLFDDDIEAWVHGPVCRTLYSKYNNYGSREINEKCETGFIRIKAKKIMDTVWEVYGSFSGPQLEYLTHKEDPWKQARERANVKPWESCSEKISPSSMEKYYSKALRG
jgi:uncharacterized phage-associated protein